MLRFKCSICGYVYDEAAGIPEQGIAPGTKWEDLPDDYVCPLCGAPMSVFKQLEGESAIPAPTSGTAPAASAATLATASAEVSTIDDDEPHEPDSLTELTAGEISAICSNLAKGCEKQRLTAEMEAWNKLAEYYKSKVVLDADAELPNAARLLGDDFAGRFPAATKAAKAVSDRGALRSLAWSERVSIIMQTLLDRFAREGDAMLRDTKIYVCEICGFISIGDAPPEICPICKVPNFRITQVERR